MKKIKCAIVEDSNVQRTFLEQVINKTSNLELLYSFTSSTEALEKINSSHIDLLFLDIEMPVMNGFEFLAGLKTIPQVIITSQNPKYALEAFDYNAIDFLLKPYSKTRFEFAVKKAIKKIKTTTNSKTENKLVVKHNLKQIELNILNIQWVEALGDYVKVITPKRNYVILSTLTTFHKKLGDDKFLRVHKSYIVNLSLVERYNHEFIEIKNKKIPISRTKGIELDRLLKCVE
ncbi:LytTR family DNA-binding domain-containing protein [uncultured Maribacter sp.]|uniref:LytR/AlgR family response regulator transcription factor n=1 Tax=uncultured Maribacter sp. TaxID=431308 RepID=UPI0030D6D297|tara:strand:+ start:47 stop:742 length:696 start_codon:yes stop_codon:yes gene_type:complete